MKQQLARAEYLWTDIHHRLGTGLSDFGAVATAYAKALEVPLHAALAPVFQSPAYQEAYAKLHPKKPLQKPTLGSMIFLLQTSQKYPEDVQRMLASRGIQIPYDGSLAEELDQVAKIRNDGAYTQTVDEQALLKLRSALLGGRLLARLAASLVPALRLHVVPEER